MTVSTTSNKSTGTGNGSQTVFPYEFAIQQASDMDVYKAGTLQGSGYTVSINPNGVGGNVTFSTAPADGVALLFIRTVDYIQSVSLPTEGNLPETTLEIMHDKSMMAIQQIKEITDRCLKMNVASGINSLAGINSLTDLAGYIPVVNADEDDFELKSPSTIANEVTAANGDVNGPAVAVDSNLVAFDGTTGKLLKDSGITIPDPTSKAFYPARVNSGGDGLEYQNIAMTELTIAGDSITPTGPVHFVDTEGDAASDDLDTITTGSVPDGHSLILFAANGARDVVIKHGTGNIFLVGDADKTLDDDEKAIMLVRNGSNWYEAVWNSGSAASIEPIATSQSIVPGGLLTLPHGLGVTPSRVWMVLRCTTANSYDVGDTICIPGSSGDMEEVYGNPSAYTSRVDATNVYIRWGNTNTVILANKTSGFPFPIMASYWEVDVYCE